MTAVSKAHQVFLYDCSFRRPDDFTHFLKKSIGKDSPDLFCFSANSFSFENALYWAGICRQQAPHAQTMFGGFHPTIFPHQAIAHPFVDNICIGEGEEAFLEFLGLDLQDRESSVPGTWRKTPQGRIIESSLRPWIEDLDVLPMVDWSFWDMEYYMRFGGVFRGGIRMLASRGCPFSCGFCSVDPIAKAIPGNYYRCHSPERVVEEMVSLYEKFRPLGGRYIHFDDANFGLNIHQLRGIHRVLFEKGIKDSIPWAAKMHPKLLTPERAQHCKEMGCFQVSLGIEHADAQMRKNVLMKNVEDEDIERSIALLKKNGIACMPYFIFCAPQETLRTFFLNFKKLVSMCAVKNFISFYYPLPKTLMAERFGERHSQGRSNKLYVLQRVHYSNIVMVVASVILAVYKLLHFLFMGVYFRGAFFFSDIFAFLLNSRGQRSLPLGDTEVWDDLYRNTIPEYYFRRHLSTKKGLVE